MDAPANLPRTEADLAEWSVFADHLLTVGDPRGEALAMELAMPVRPSRELIRAFQALSPRLPQTGAHLQFGYQLGHVVTLSIAPAPHLKMARASINAPQDGSIGRAMDLVTTPVFSRLRELEMPIAGATLEPNLLRLLRRLPASCQRLTLTIGHATPELIDALIAALPPSITEVSLVRCAAPLAARWFTDRFALIELGRITGELDVGQLLDASPSTRACVLHANEPLHPRLRLGYAGGMLEPVDGHIYETFARASRMFTTVDPIAIAFPRRSLLELQTRFGLIPIRSQLAHELPEQHSVRIAAMLFVEVMRVEDRWTIRQQHSFAADDPQSPFAIDGVPVAADTITPITDGARVTLGGKTLEFATHDLEERLRARCRAG